MWSSFFALVIVGQLDAGEIALLTGRPNDAVEPLTQAAQQKNERAAWLRGVALFESGNETGAREAFSEYLVTYLNGEYQIPARLGIAIANERLGRARASAEIYKALLVQHPQFDDEPYALLRLSKLTNEAKYEDRLRREYPGIAPTYSSFILHPSSFFRIQVGAFGARENAEKLLATFTARGYRGEVVPRENLFLVQVGSYSSSAAAEAARADVESISGGRTVIIKK